MQVDADIAQALRANWRIGAAADRFGRKRGRRMRVATSISLNTARPSPEPKIR
jgi:hypothetical protein